MRGPFFFTADSPPSNSRIFIAKTLYMRFVDSKYYRYIDSVFSIAKNKEKKSPILHTYGGARF